MKDEKYCRDCFKKIEDDKGSNSYYCKSCARRRKKASDHESFKRRSQARQKEENLSPRAKRTRGEVKLKSQHAAQLGIPVVYYDLWKQENPEAYNSWMDKQLGAGR